MPDEMNDDSCPTCEDPSNPYIGRHCIDCGRDTRIPVAPVKKVPMPDDVKPASPPHAEAFNGVLLEPSIHGVLAVSDGTVLFGLTWEQALRLSEWVSRVSRYTLIKASPQNRPTFTDLRARVAALEAENAALRGSAKPASGGSTNLPLRLTQSMNVCRVCGLPMSPPFVLNFGTEFAHKDCLKEPS